uniref:Immunoglobulin V-set domain-containing protein n=1 Tax=Cyprinus carpio TaxID=7962 RepID=A0A8C2CZC4_CYPCA
EVSGRTCKCSCVSAGVFDGVSVFVTEGDSVTLLTGIKKNQEDRIRWYCNDTRIAQINGDPSKTCTDVQCNEGTERFRDRLKLDHQTGSLTIMNITNTDSGFYQLKIFSSNSISEKTFSLSSFDVTVISNLTHSFIHTNDGLCFVPDSGLSLGAVAGLSVIVLLLVTAAVAVGVIFYHRRNSRNGKYHLLILH